jgi:uncharacterized protein (DUF1684 family)
MDYFSLADWRRQVAEMYAAVRRNPNHPQAWESFRAGRDRLFKQHPQSPLDENQRQAFSGLAYYPYDESYRVWAAVSADLGDKVGDETITIELPEEGAFNLVRAARLTFALGGTELALTAFWVQGYGGGLFLPFRDATSGKTTYGGGRYLYDTIKGADLGATGPAASPAILLDFNYAYNPSCAYNPRWVCPLSPAENRLSFPIAAGEKVFDQIEI